jgi:hypothetical protein
VAFRQPLVRSIYHVEIVRLLENFVFWVADYVADWRFRSLFS